MRCDIGSEYLLHRKCIVLFRHECVCQRLDNAFRQRRRLFVNDIIKEFKYIENIPLYKGGPIATDTLFYLHTLADIPGAIPISKGLYLNGDFDEIKKYILQGNKVDRYIRFFLGYSGWESEQLSTELKENTWLVSKEENAYLMNGDTKDMWKQALEKLGSKYETWSRFPQVPTFN